MNFQTYILDFDGTIADTAPLIIATKRATVKELGLPPKTDAEFKGTIGLRLIDVPNVLWPEFPGIGEKYAETYRIIFEEIKSKYPVKLFPGVTETLNSLKENGKTLTIATSRGKISLYSLLHDLGIAGYFDMVVGGEDVKNGKPSPEAVLKILKELKENPRNAVVVGDMPVDISMGKAAGTSTCAVTYGNASIQNLKISEPDYLIDSFSELL